MIKSAEVEEERKRMIPQTDFIKQVKRRYGVTDQELARLMKCSEQRVLLLEQGKEILTSEDIMRVCHGFHMSREQIFDFLKPNKCLDDKE